MTLEDLHELITRRLGQRPDMAAMTVTVREGSSWGTPSDFDPDGGLYIELGVDGDTAILTVKG